MSVEITKHASGLPQVRVVSLDGASVDVHLQGAHVDNWVTAKKRRPLFMSRDAVFQTGKALRGGIPICWPQFSDLGPIAVMHGYARTAQWHFKRFEVDSNHASTAVFSLQQPEDAPSPYRHCCVEYVVTLAAERLSVRLDVVNQGTESVTFTAALHTYFSVSDISAVRIEGVLDSVEWADNLEHRAVKPAAEIRTIDKETDRIYRGTGGHPVTVVDTKDGVRTIITANGLDDTVLWNPWIEKAKKMADLNDDAYIQFVCVESAAIKTPVVLLPGAKWSGAQVVNVE